MYIFFIFLSFTHFSDCHEQAFDCCICVKNGSPGLWDPVAMQCLCRCCCDPLGAPYNDDCKLKSVEVCIYWHWFSGISPIRRILEWRWTIIVKLFKMIFIPYTSTSFLYIYTLAHYFWRCKTKILDLFYVRFKTYISLGCNKYFFINRMLMVTVSVSYVQMVH